jgi:hypothetical protein
MIARPRARRVPVATIGGKGAPSDDPHDADVDGRGGSCDCAQDDNFFRGAKLQ